MPRPEAADLRRKAETLEGQDRAYCLWLAREWEKTEARFGAGSTALDPTPLEADR